MLVDGEAIVDRLARVLGEIAVAVSISLARPGQIATSLPVVVDRYAGAERWGAVLTGIQVFYGPQSASAGRWAAVQYKIRQATAAEEKLRQAQRQLPKELPALVKEALADGLRIQKDSGTYGSQQFLRQIAESPEGRVRLGRGDMRLVGGIYEIASGRVRLLEDA